MAAFVLVIFSVDYFGEGSKWFMCFISVTFFSRGMIVWGADGVSRVDLISGGVTVFGTVLPGIMPSPGAGFLFGRVHLCTRFLALAARIELAAGV